MREKNGGKMKSKVAKKIRRRNEMYENGKKKVMPWKFKKKITIERESE